MSPYPFTHLYVVSLYRAFKVVIGIFNTEERAENAIRTLPKQLVRGARDVDVSIHKIPCDTTISMDTDARCVRMCPLSDLWSESSALPDDVSYQKPGPGCPVYYVYETTMNLDWSENIVYISDTQNNSQCYKVVINSLIFDGIVNSTLNRLDGPNHIARDFEGDDLPPRLTASLGRIGERFTYSTIINIMH